MKVVRNIYLWLNSAPSYMYRSRRAGASRGLRRAPALKRNGVPTQALRGFKAAIDAALGRGSQALIDWIERLS